jgi:hypothetical protein
VIGSSLPLPINAYVIVFLLIRLVEFLVMVLESKPAMGAWIALRYVFNPMEPGG